MSDLRRFNSVRHDFYTTKKLNNEISKIIDIERSKGNKRMISGGKSFLIRTALEQLIYDYWNKGNS